MRRRLFATVASVSAIMAVAAVVVWISSYSFVLDAAVPVRVAMFSVYALRGELELEVMLGRPSDLHGSYPTIRTNSLPPRVAELYKHARWHHWAGFGFSNQHLPGRGRYIKLVMPFWFTTLATAWLPAIGVYRRFRHKSRPLHPCFKCGYDLHGTMEGGRGRCPECGTPIVWEGR